MDLREKILSKSSQLMMSIGPQSVTMDMVARDCGISKRTLYETFPNKHALISAVVKHSHDTNSAKYKQIFEESENSFAALMGVYVLLRHYLRNISTVYMSDIKRLYPEIFNQYKAQETAHRKSLSKIIKQAQDEGFVLPDINCDIASFLLSHTMKNLHDSEDLRNFNYNPIYVFDGAFLNFMRGIATEKGRDIIHTYVEKHIQHETINNNL